MTHQRGRPIGSDLVPLVMATVHPSSILRAGPAAWPRWRRPSPTCGPSGSRWSAAPRQLVAPEGQGR
ncbi:MAG TPA: hypothetical protein VET90_09195, partial [Candidatus Binatus sp.]|nr:hypothetical protein [Candidatus Binatus sp.]